MSGRSLAFVAFATMLSLLVVFAFTLSGLVFLCFPACRDFSMMHPVNSLTFTYS